MMSEHHVVVVDDDVPPVCPMCKNEQSWRIQLGRLGSLLWWRCRDCGIDFYETLADKDTAS